jgi:enoyl-CoA hydratase/carnithine racemase
VTLDLETGTDELLARREDAVVVLTLNRPKARNSLSDDLSPALRRMFAKLPDARDVRCVLVTGTGTAFCSGGDVKGMGGGATRSAPRSADEIVADLTERQRKLTGALHALPQPTIAALPGPAVGAGLAIALACDLRIAAESAFVSTGFANVGLAGDYGVSWFLPRLVGPAKAKELFFTAERVGATECERLGIVNRVVPDDRLMDEALSLARTLAAGPTVTYGLMKANLDRALSTDLPTQLGFEAAATVASAQTEDHREAVRAFIEKRKPVLNGR